MSSNRVPPDPKVQRQFTISLLVSFLILMGGMLWTWKIGWQANRYYHEIGHEEFYVDFMTSNSHKQGAKKR